MAAVRGAAHWVLLILIIIGASGRFCNEGRMEKEVSNVTGSIATSTQHNCVIGDDNDTAGLEQQINVKVGSNVSDEGIRPLGMAARSAIDIIAASSETVKQGDRPNKIPAVELSIGEEVLIQPWDVWLGNTRHHRTGLVYNAHKEKENNVASCMQIDTAEYHQGDDTLGVVESKDASAAPATKKNQWHWQGRTTQSGDGKRKHRGE